MPKHSRVRHELAWTPRYVLLAAGIWLASLLAGLVMDLLQAPVKAAPAATAGLTASIPATSFLGYLLHNASIAIASWLGGITGLIPLWILYQNGLSLASFLIVTSEQPANIAAGRLAFLLPHGLFEIPAILLASAASLYILHTTAERILNPHSQYSILSAYIRTLPVLLGSLVLFMVGAWLESHIGPNLAHLIANGGLL